jgi:hypothetical protein
MSATPAQVSSYNDDLSCRHELCALIGGPCSVKITRSRGCRPNIVAREVAPAVIDEVRTLLAGLDRDGALRLAQIIRREALDDRNLVAIARADELDFAAALARLL